ncbi:hypothetical protein E2562_016764 [Oryza meyeriana var. granulata]|uniref:Uncharacterized protein n=1 Tax=Oryza meyeriana var. granulata TaxID=110450 RepID=A0A6G1BLU1_9ORYZ|nr:hypothetical protein E2562_016764 [Oryza meyeriana var. granulata]
MGVKTYQILTTATAARRGDELGRVVLGGQGLPLPPLPGAAVTPAAPIALLYDSGRHRLQHMSSAAAEVPLPVDAT